MAYLPKDRLNALLSHPTLNGIDFVEVANAAQTQLNVHFLNANALTGTVTSAAVTGGETITSVRVLPFTGADWSTVNGRPVLALHVAAPGDFSNYTLTLTSASLDRFFDRVLFSFKAGCPSDLDCAIPCSPCGDPPDDTPPIDYTAKDFLSFRKALTDFSALRYPEWLERSEADAGMMFLEALCALGDDLSYTQDRIGWEAYLDTATQRRSLVRLARLVDYEPRPATCARVLLQFDVTGGPIPPGVVVSAQAPDGTIVDFETGSGLLDTQNYAVSPLWNRGKLTPYFWDDSQECLASGATDAWIVGHNLGFYAGQTLLIDTRAQFPADPPVREIVRLVSTEETTDPLFLDPSDGQPYKLTHIVWRADDALTHDHDLTRTALAGNLLPATQARRYAESFAIDVAPATARNMPTSIARLGASHVLDAAPFQYGDGAFVAGVSCGAAAAPPAPYLHHFTLAHAPMAWLAPSGDDSALPEPEISVLQEDVSPSMRWSYRRSLLHAEQFEAAFTVDPFRYARIGVGGLDGQPILDYDGDQGDTVRFGDGVFGDLPESGAYFRVHYRVGGGAIGNVGADSITHLDPKTPPDQAALIASVTNPFPAAGGADAESSERVRRLAPQAFRAKQFRAVRPEDYQNAAETLPWVERAGTRFRWTGSWLTVFTTADPKGTEDLPVGKHTDLIDLLNRYRMAGYESYVPKPHFVSLDLQITVCARPDAFRGEVEADVLKQLSTRTFPGGAGFFQVDRFTFGAPLERSALEAAIQEAAGVSGVVSILYRRRGFTSGYTELIPTVAIGPDEILRVDNDPSRPESGSIRVYVEGGK